MDRTTSLASSSASTKCVVIPLCSRASSAARIWCSVARRANSATASVPGLSPGSSPDALRVGGPLTLLSANLGEALMDQSNCHRTLVDRHDEVARRYRLGQFGQGRRARRLRAALALDAVLLDRGEVDDRVDSVPGDSELERKLDVSAPNEVDERGHRRVLDGGGDALSYAIAVGGGNRAALAQPRVIALARQSDDARARADRELDREHANATARPGDDDRLARSRGHGAYGGHPSHACDEQCARYLPRYYGRLRRQVGCLDEHVLGVACAVVGKADHLVAHGYALHACADLLDHAGEVRPFAAGKGRGEDLADPARTDRRLAGIDAGGADLHEDLVRPGLRTRHVTHLENVNATVIVESDCLHQPVTFLSARL